MIIFIAIAIGLLPAAIAQSKGRNFALWWFYGAALFIVALPHALIMKPHMKKCSQCAEFVRTEALKCRFCGSELPAPEPKDDGVIVIPRRPGADGHDRMVEDWNIQNGLTDQTRR